MKIAVIGACGQLGRDICQAFSQKGDEVIKLDLLEEEPNKIDIGSGESIQATLDRFAPLDLVINTAAFHNVEACENDPVKAFQVNAIGSLHLARAVNRLGVPILHISTDYVFGGEPGAKDRDTPYLESDRPVPLSVYGNTKLAGEYFIEANAEKYFILRVSGIYGQNPCLAKGGLNFVDLMLKLAKERDEVRVVDDEVLTPTYTEDIAGQIVHLAHNKPAFGLYHATAEGACSWYEFARAIFSLAGCPVTLNKARPGEFAAKVKRPKYSVLENKGLKDRGINIMPPWQDGLRRYLRAKYPGSPR